MFPDESVWPAIPVPGAPGLEQGKGSGRGILVVDDDADLARGLTRILNARGYEVYQAIGGRQAVEMARSHRLKAILTDIIMPDLNGIEASREIRAACPGIFVLFMTGFAEIEKEALAEGAAAVFRKPIDFSRLFETLDGLGLRD